MIAPKLLRQRCAELPESSLQLLRLKAVTGGFSSSLLGEFLREARIAPPRGQVWNPGDMKSTLHALRRLELLNEKEHVVPALEHDLCLDGLKSIGPAVRRVLLRGAGSHTLALRLRLAVYERDLKAYAKAEEESASLYEGGVHPFDGQFIDTATAPRWLASLPPRMALDILANNLTPLIEAGTITPNLSNALDVLQKLRPVLIDLPPCPPLVLFDALSGRHAEARSQLVPLLLDRNQFQGPLLQGIIAFLEGGDALPPLREALRRLRKISGKRKASLPGIGGLCLVLSLLRTEQPEARDECAALLHDLSPRQATYKGFMAARFLLEHAEGRSNAATLKQLAPLPSDPFSEAVFRAADAGIDNGSHDVPAIAHQFERLKERLPLIACLLAETLTILQPSGPWKAWAEGFPAKHVRLGDFLDHREDWERVFEVLLRKLRQPERTAPKRRLGWLLDLETFKIEALEQSAKGEDWTAWRNIPFKRLHEEAETLEWLTEQDKAVLSGLRWSKTWSGLSCDLDPFQALPALAGHPYLFRAQDRAHVTLACKPVELVVREERNGYSLSLSRWLPRGEMQCTETAPGTYILYHLPEKLEEVSELLGRNGLNIPIEGGPRVLELIRSLDETVVRPVIRAEAHTAEIRLLMRLRPLGTGIEAALHVRPFGTPDTPAFPVGEGPAAPLAESGGRTARTERDFEAEVHAARDFVRTCPTLRERGGIGPWEISDLEESLDCLLELEQSGIELEWPEGKRLRVCPQISASRLVIDVHHSRDWFQLHGQLSINESLVMDMAQMLEHLRQAKGRYVPLGNDAFLALTKQFRQQLDRLDRLTERDGAKLRLHPLAADTVQDLFDGAEINGDEVWENQLRLAHSAGTLAVPSTLRAELRDYQMAGFVWMTRLAGWGAGACLADDMGLGKTVQTIAVLLERSSSGPSIIFAPTSVCHNWENELSRFAPTLSAHRFGPGNRTAQVASLGPGDVLITSYGLLHAEAQCLASRQWETAVFDEAQALKNADTRRSRASRQIPAAFRIALTGTPIENRLEDLWSLFNLINPGLLGTRQSFQRRFSDATPPTGRVETATEETGISEAQSAARQALRMLIRPFILRRTKSDVLAELPPRTEQVLEVELPEEERAFYEALRRNALESLEKKHNSEEEPGKISILAELTRLRRACCVPELVEPGIGLPGAKLAAFMELVDELVRGGHKALVFSQFVGCLAEARKRLDAAGYACQYLDGSTPEKDRQAAVAAFQSGTGDLFLISLKAGGQGLNLTAADYVIHLDPWWNPAVEDQASDRAYRIGQQRPVTVYRMVARGTVEESILRLHRSKRTLAEDVLEGADVALSEAELVELIRR